MDDVERRAGNASELDRAMRRLTLKECRSGRAVKARIAFAASERLGDQHVDGDAVFRVHHDRRAVARRLLHRLKNLAVVRVEHARDRP